MLVRPMPVKTFLKFPPCPFPAPPRPTTPPLPPSLPPPPLPPLPPPSSTPTFFSLSTYRTKM